MMAKDWTDEELDARSATSKGLGLRPPNRWAETGRTAEQLARLGTDTDEAIAAKVGCTRSQRSIRGIPPAAPKPAV